MPNISEFYGLKVRMYFADHPPPHFHVIYGEHEAKVRISDGEVFAGSLPRRAVKLVREWWELRKAEIGANWDRIEADLPLHRIGGLDE